MNSVVKLLDTNKYSINIKDDYMDNRKINSYYPSNRNLKLLDKFLNMIESERGYSVLLSGAYGTGKSYFTAILLNILSGEYNREKYSTFLKKSEKIFPIKETLNKFENKKYFIVFLDDSMKEFSKTVLQGIEQSAKSEKISLNLSTKFEIVEEKINKWNDEYPEIYRKFSMEVGDIENFKDMLSEKKDETIDIFKNTYSKIFPGEKFFFFEKPKKIDILLKEVEEQILRLGYAGVIYVFDEFGRYLETNIEELDVKEIQDMSEYCNNENKSSILLITHKDVFQYTNNLGNSILKDEWEKVSGRFMKEHLIYDKINVLEIMENIIECEDYKEYREKNKTEFLRKEELLDKLETINDEGIRAVEKFYPLDYLTATLLPDFSQKFAQNERTLFSFLCGEEEKSLKNILKKNNSEIFIGLDRIFDYFEDNFRRMASDTMEYKVYINIKNILQNIPKSEKNMRKFIKSLGVICIYNRYGEIAPSPDTMQYLLNIKNIKDIENNLKEKNYIQYRRHSNLYKIVEDIDVNVEKEVKEYVEKKLNNFSYMETLNQNIGDKYYYPLKYNDKRKINRFLSQSFLDVSNINLDSLKEKIYDDGKIIYLTNIENNENYLEIKNYLENEDLIIAYNPKGKKLNILEELKELEAILRLEVYDEKYSKEDIVKKELDSYKKEIIEKIEGMINLYFKDCSFTNKNCSEDNKKSLINITYEYLERKYFNYVNINYELINKHSLSVPMKKARMDIIKKLLNKDILTEEYFKDTKAESSVGRILLKYTEIYKDEKLNIENSTFGEIYNNILEDIKREKISVNKIYEKYCSNLGTYGIRKGIFTFLLGIVIIKNLEEISIINSFNKSEIDFNGDVLELIEKNPEKYELNYYNLSEKEYDYMKNMEKLFFEYISNFEDKIYNRVLMGIKNYVLGLPRYITGIYIKELPGINKIYKGIFNLTNGKEFLLETIPKIYKIDNYEEIRQKIEYELNIIEEKKEEFYKNLSKEVCNIYGYENVQLKDMLNELSKKNNKNKIEEFILKFSDKNEKIILSELTKEIKGFSCENWRSITDLEEFKKLLLEKLNDEKDIEIDLEERENLKLSFGKYEKTINLNIEVSSTGKLFKAKLESHIKNIGKSISEEEKIKILASILMEI